MKTRELLNLGIPRGPLLKTAQIATAAAAAAGQNKRAIRASMLELMAQPQAYLNHMQFGELAAALRETLDVRARFDGRQDAAPFCRWGNDLEAGAIAQMENACRLPVAVCGALMPDAHQGYGLPIGGVLATRGTVIPFAVGMDIACRMKLTVLDLPLSLLEDRQEVLAAALERETAFGVGASFSQRKNHPVMDRDWSLTALTRRYRDKAWSQLGTSGSGNHFVEFGVLTLPEDDLGLAAGSYLALLSHSGSRGTGGLIAEHFSRIAQERHPELPRELQALAWLDLDSEAGQEYWWAMELMGAYAAANHALIHGDMARRLGAEVLLDVENHHNFAWKEELDGEEVIVHRKGATPAGAGVLGIIPGSMATAGYLVRGLGESSSLASASHGAGRKMSRKAARQTFTWQQARAFLAARNVRLLSAGLDEVPMAYKDIEEVMAAQAELVTPVARFDPRLVKMAAD
ncbi:MAG: RtcB family protein [Desulfuromonadaceae bacterium]